MLSDMTPPSRDMRVKPQLCKSNCNGRLPPERFPPSWLHRCLCEALGAAACPAVLA
jgi:hypothetical protein